MSGTAPARRPSNATTTSPGARSEAWQGPSDDTVRTVMPAGDVSMPRISGPELFEQIRALLPEAFVVLASGFNHSDLVRRAMSRGLAGFLQKPFRLEELDGLLAQAMRRKATD